MVSIRESLRRGVDGKSGTVRAVPTMPMPFGGKGKGKAASIGNAATCSVAEMVPLTNGTTPGTLYTGRDLKRQRAPNSTESQVDSIRKKSSGKNVVDVGAAVSPNSSLDFQALDGRLLPQPKVPFRRVSEVVSISEVMSLSDDEDLDSQRERAATRLTGTDVDDGINNYLQAGEVRAESDDMDTSSKPQDILTVADGADNANNHSLKRPPVTGPSNAPCVMISNRVIWKQFSTEGYVPTKQDISMALDELMRVATTLKKKSESAENAPGMRNCVEHGMERANDPSIGTEENDTTILATSDLWKQFALEKYIPTEKDTSAALDECFKLSREINLVSQSLSAEEIADRRANRPDNIIPPGPSELDDDDLDDEETVPGNISTKIPGIHFHKINKIWEAHIWIDNPTFPQWHGMKYELTNAIRARLQEPPVTPTSIWADGRNPKRKDMQLYVGCFPTEEQAKIACDMVNLKFSATFQTFHKRLHFPNRDYAPEMHKYSQYNALMDFLWIIKRNSSGFKGTTSKFTRSSKFGGVCSRKASFKDGGKKFYAHISRKFKPADDSDTDIVSVRISFPLGSFSKEKEAEAARLVDRASLFLNAVTADQERDSRQHPSVCTNFRPSEYSVDEILAMREKLLAVSRPCLLNAELHESVVKWWK